MSQYTGPSLVGVDGTPLRVEGKALVSISLGTSVFISCVIVVAQLSTEAILGLDFLEKHQCVIDVKAHQLTLDGCVSIPFQSGPRESDVAHNPQDPISVSCVQTIHIPPHSEIMLEGSTQHPVSGTWLVEAVPTKSNIVAARSLVQPDHTSVIPVRILNPSAEGITIHKGTKVASMDTLDECCLVAPVQSGESVSSRDISKDLRELVSHCSESLSPPQQQQLLGLLMDFRDILAGSSADLGQTTQIQHSIFTGDHKPIRQPPRRVPVGQRHEVRTELQAMLNKGVIQPSTSPWASPLVLVRKKDGSIRFCADYRKLNAVTRKDAYPLPRIDETLDTLSGSVLFTTLDLLSGYWQVQVHPHDKEKTTVCTPEGLFEFNVMPFGLCNAPATFQRLMDCVLAGLHWETCLVYLDDVIILGKTFDEHLVNLHGVFQRLHDAGLKLKPSKCNLCQNQVKFLGHVVSGNGVAADPSKVESIKTWPTPSQCKEVQQFLGLCNYYRRFIRNFATIAKPLHRLTEKAHNFEWTRECEEAFGELKSALTTAPILSFPVVDAPFILDTDASNVGIGAVLAQEVDGVERVIAYGSRLLTKSERRYCVTRRELLAVITFLQHFRPYLLGRHFVVRTNHGSLTWLRNFKDPEGQLARWLERLQEHHFDIVHRPGCLHGNADALSRIPCRQCGRQESVLEPVLGAVLVSDVPGTPQEELQTAQENDPHIGDILKAKRDGKDSKQISTRGCSPEFKRLLQLWNQFCVKRDLLYRVYESEDGKGHYLQLVVPAMFQQEILQQLHSGPVGGHLGTDKTHSKVKQRYYWPGYWKDVQVYCLNCKDCATRKTPTHRRKAALQPVVTGYPLEIVAVDITGPFPQTSDGNRYILVAGDYFTKWTEAYAIVDQEATTVAKKLVDEFICRFSVPHQLHSDQGRQFESKLI